MRQLLIVVAMTAILLAIYAAFNMSESPAEPILGAESVADPWNITAPTQDISEALTRFKAGDFDGALRRWKEIVKKNADLPRPAS